MLRDLVNFILIIILKMFSKVKINYKARINFSVFLYLLKFSKKYVNIREAILSTGIKLDEGSQFFSNPELFGNVQIGKYTTICGPSTRVCAGINKVIIGSYCSIASNVIIQEYYHKTNLVTTYSILNTIFNKHNINLERESKGDIIIEDDVWIGSNVVILSGVKIGRGSIVGAGSIVTKSVPPYSVVGGNPAKVLRVRFDQEKIDRLESSKWWEWSREEVLKNEDFFNNNDK